jgi:thiol-disulfide isomerase/thioredoxin
MDRLSTLIALGTVLAACEKQSSEPPPSRTNASKVTTSEVTVEELCDKHFAGDTGPLLKLPPLVDGAIAPTSTTWRWINIWATWCKPCVEEMPRLVRWRDKLAAGGKPVDLAFISIDEDPADVADYRTEHPQAPPSPRLAVPGKQSELYTSVGLDAGAPVPIHVFVRPSGHVACARAGSVRDRDLPAIEKLLAQ